MLGREAKDKEKIAQRLRHTRMALKMTQAEMSRFIDITPQTWNNAETGDYRLGLNLAVRLCEKTGCTLDWLYLGRPSGMPIELLQKIKKTEKEA